MVAQGSEDMRKQEPGIIASISRLFGRNRPSTEASTAPKTKEKIEWLSYVTPRVGTLEAKGDLPEKQVLIHGVSKDDKYLLISEKPLMTPKYKVKASDLK